MPHANDFITDAFGDGLNYADHKYLLVRHGNNDNQSIVGSESQAERKQINILAYVPEFVSSPTTSCCGSNVQNTPLERGTDEL